LGPGKRSRRRPAVGHETDADGVGVDDAGDDRELGGPRRLFDAPRSAGAGGGRRGRRRIAPGPSRGAGTAAARSFGQRRGPVAASPQRDGEHDEGASGHRAQLTSFRGGAARSPAIPNGSFGGPGAYTGGSWHGA